MARNFMMLLLAIGVLGSPGCAGGSHDQGPLSNGSAGTDLAHRDASDADWPYWPRRMRIHPLTQLATDRDTGQLVIETRVEFFDSLGHTTKGIGQVLVDLHAARSAETEPLETWALNLADPQVNADHYDDLTRTYLFRLEFDPLVLPDRPEIRAYFRSSDGRRLQAEQPFQLKK